MKDPDIIAIPGFKQALLSPDEGCHPLLCEIILHPLLDQMAEVLSRKGPLIFQRMSPSLLTSEGTGKDMPFILPAISGPSKDGRARKS